jgi:aromatic-L-amino-acid decarboxylase
MFIRDSKLLTEVLDLTPPFLRNQSGYGQVTDYRNWGLSLGRRFRSLKILFVLRSYGVQGFQAHLVKSIELGKTFEQQVNEDESFELVTPRSLALVVFRLCPKNFRQQDAEALNELNKRFYARLHEQTSIQLSESISKKRHLRHLRGLESH